MTDFQKFNACHLADVNSFYLSLAESLADQLDLDVFSRCMGQRRGPNVNFERFIRGSLDHMHAPLVWGLDEVDRLFSCPFGSEVFGCFEAGTMKAPDPSHLGPA